MRIRITVICLYVYGWWRGRTLGLDKHAEAADFVVQQRVEAKCKEI